MKITRRQALISFATILAVSCQLKARKESADSLYIRFQKDGKEYYGILEGDVVTQIEGDIFGEIKRLDVTHQLNDVKVLSPCFPTKILALAGNYRSHRNDPSSPKNPEVFYKPVSALQNPGDPIILPKEAEEVHYEGELVIVIGQKSRRISVVDAEKSIFGVTCGNDISERIWQNGPQKDVQWWRAKGADTFAPVGPYISSGINYGNLMMKTRLNGQTVQEVSTSELIFDCQTVVSFISQYVTLMPGDLIFTGTSGKTGPLNPGDKVEVEIEGVGVLQNNVISSQQT